MASKPRVTATRICLTYDQLLTLILLGKSQVINSAIPPERQLDIIRGLGTIRNGDHGAAGRYVEAVQKVVSAAPGKDRADAVRAAAAVAATRPAGRTNAGRWLQTGQAVEAFGSVVSMLPFEPADGIGEFFQAAGQITQTVAGLGKGLDEAWRRD